MTVSGDASIPPSFPAPLLADAALVDGDPHATSARTRAKATRRERILKVRAISVPVAIVQRFFHIDGIRKSMLIAFNLFVSIVPLFILAFAIVGRVHSRITLGQVFSEQLELDAETRNIVRTAFPTNRGILQIVSVISVVSFAVSGFDVAAAMQRVFAEAWGVPHYRGWRAALRGGVWFVAVFATFALSQVLQFIPHRTGGIGYALSGPAVFAMYYGFWQATPRLMLDQPLSRRHLRQGALLGTVVATSLWAISKIILPGWFNWYGRGFGGIGIALAMLSWIYVVSISWVVTVAISAVMWERSAPVDDVVDLVES